jgi:hypothetical protein
VQPERRDVVARVGHHREAVGTEGVEHPARQLGAAGAARQQDYH